MADTLEELHEMAGNIGMKRSWFQSKPNRVDHYDLVESKRAAAVALGAIELKGHKAFCEVYSRLREAQKIKALITEEGQ